jgi:hypothetical protein
LKGILGGNSRSAKSLKFITFSVETKVEAKMVTTVLSKVKESQSRLILGNPVRPKINRLVRTEPGRSVATKIAVMLTGPELGTVTGFLRVHGVCVVNIAEKEEAKGELSGWFFSKENLPAMHPFFFPLSVAQGDMGIVFNPLKSPTPTALEHQCWRVYLDCVFPNFGLEIRWLTKKMGKAHPDLVPFFLKPFVHLYLRLAALHAGLEKFVVADEKAGLSNDLARLDRLPPRRLNDLNLTAAVAGLTLGYALPFYEGQAIANNTLTQWLKKYFESKREKYKNIETIFDHATQLAEQCHKACFDGESESLVTEGICSPILALWRQAFPNQFSQV